MAYGARLESGLGRKLLEGSNPSPSARKQCPTLRWVLFFGIGRGVRSKIPDFADIKRRVNPSPSANFYN